MDRSLQAPDQLHRLYNGPALIRPDEAQRLLLLPKIIPAHAMDQDDVSVIMGGNDHVERSYIVINSIAVISIRGPLFQRSWYYWSWGFTGYDRLRLAIATALEDDEVKGIFFDIDSPGGEVAGCFDLVDFIAAVRGEKPMWAAVNECCCSAAYAIASALDHITIARTGCTGSIGVIWMHVDWSKWLEKEGFKVTFVTYGEHKADGASELPLSKEAFANAQQQINAVGDIFVNTVARGRKLGVKAIRRQEAAVFMGSDAIDEGLADEVMPIDQSFAAFRAELKL